MRILPTCSARARLEMADEASSTDRMTTEVRAQAYDAAQGRRASLRVLSAYDLDRQVISDGSTWLDRQLVSRNTGMLAKAGFGAEVRSALGRRKDELIRQGHAWRTPEGGVRARRDLLPALERQEVERVGRKLAAERGLAFHDRRWSDHSRQVDRLGPTRQRAVCHDR